MLHYNKIDLPKFDVLPALQSLIETDKVYWIQPALNASDIERIHIVEDILP